MSEIVVTEVSAEGGRVEYGYDYDSDLHRFFGDDLVVEYDVDVSEVPEAILVIPCIANLAPVAWATGADLYVPKLDGRFLDALARVRRGFERVYPEFVAGSEGVEGKRGEVRVGERVDDPEGGSDPQTAGDPAILFSGGVDSLASYVRHRETDPYLVTIHGFDITLDDREAWAKRAPELRAFGEARGLKNRFVRMNVHSALNVFLLNAEFGDHYADDWITSVGYGLCLLGTCAPLTAAESIDALHIAASGWKGFEPPGGSHHEIVNEVAWSGTEIEHDVYELTRQQRIQRIADYVQDEDPDLQIRACSREGDNCSRCLKCMRTAVGLLLAGLDPADHGYEFGPESFEYVRRRLETDDWRLSEYERLMWADIQNYIDPDREYPYDEATPFFEWLQDADVESLGADPAESSRDEMLYAVARHTPYPVFSLLYGVYRAADEFRAR